MRAVHGVQVGEMTDEFKAFKEEMRIHLGDVRLAELDSIVRKIKREAVNETLERLKRLIKIRTRLKYTESGKALTIETCVYVQGRKFIDPVYAVQGKAWVFNYLNGNTQQPFLQFNDWQAAKEGKKGGGDRG